jgi:ABC-type bacteriocin/lantibiotic exporter with double-glycine peptidase domain
LQSSSPASSSTSPTPAPSFPRVRPAIIAQANDEQLLLFLSGANAPQTISLADFSSAYTGVAFQLARASRPLNDPDNALADKKRFGFRWFIPELLNLNSSVELK